MRSRRNVLASLGLLFRRLATMLLQIESHPQSRNGLRLPPL
jgi:hypothetical protein